MKTSIIRNEILKQESIEDLAEYFKRHNDDVYKPWKAKFGNLLRDSGLSISEIAEGLNVSPSSVKRMKKSVPFQRVCVIMIACMLGMSADETDELLTKYCKFAKLYAKNPEDFIWLWLCLCSG